MTSGLHFINAKGATGWGVVLLKDGEAIAHWTPAEAEREGRALLAKAGLCRRPGLLPA